MAQWARIEQGAGTLLLINQRETGTADARLRELEALVDYPLARSVYLALTEDLAALGLEALEPP